MGKRLSPQEVETCLTLLSQKNAQLGEALRGHIEALESCNDAAPVVVPEPAPVEPENVFVPPAPEPTSEPVEGQTV